MFKYIKFDLFLVSRFDETWAGRNEDIKNQPEIKDEVKQIDTSNMTVEQKKEYEKITKRIEDLNKELDIINSWEKTVWARFNRLNKWMDNEVTFQELPEKDADDIREKMLKLKNELSMLKEEKLAIERTLDTMKDNKLTHEELVKMQTISNDEFLKTPVEERLKFITVWNVDYKNVWEIWVKNIEFTFTFDWKYNDQLYARTTAGQVLPETVRSVECNWEVFERKWINWEFFSQNWQRLIIEEWTQINVSKFATSDELKLLQEQLQWSLAEFKDSPNLQLASESLKKWYDPKLIVSLFWDEYQKITDPIQKKLFIEQSLTEVARIENDFNQDYQNEYKTIVDWKTSLEFTWYLLNAINNTKAEQISKDFGYDLDRLKSFKRQWNSELWGWPINMENVNLDWISKEEINQVLQKKRFVPGSRDAIILFTVACQSAWLPVEWAKSKSTHEILWHESNWKVWILNYTMKNISTETFKQKATSNYSNNPTWVKSTASGLGQLLLSNVDKFYPDWRAWIWDALNEAVWMLRYVKDRYWSPDVCMSVYWKMWSYEHPTKWTQYKNFQEWY